MVEAGTKEQYKRALLWPVVAAVAIYVVVILLKFVDGTSSVLGGITFLVIVGLALGAWAGASMASTPITVLIAGAALGVLSGLLMVLDAFIHGDPSGEDVLAIFLVFLTLTLVGAILGGGWALSGSRRT